MGHDLPRVRMWGNCPTLANKGKYPCDFFLFLPNHFHWRKTAGGWGSYCMEGEEYGQPISNWAETHFWKNVFWLPWQEKCPKTYAILLGIHVFHFYSRFGSSWSFLCVFPSTFLAVASFFPWIGGRFCNARAWVVFLTFLELLVHFPFTFLWFHVFLPRLWRATHVFGCLTDYWSHAQTIWGRFPLLWVVFTDNLQDCVFSPMLWAIFAVTYGAV